MKIHRRKKTGCRYLKLLTIKVGVLAISSLFLSTPLIAAEHSFSGDSTTMLRMRRTVDDKSLIPIYEYLNFEVTKNLKDDSAVTLYFGAWGRGDLGDKSTGKELEGDLRYGYLSYRSSKSNTTASVGRQFISEGVVSEKIDGLYIRNDFKGGIGASAYVGKSVYSETDSKGGGILYGTRLSHQIPEYYTVGLSALKSEKENGGRYREEEGVDIWLHTCRQFDLAGRTTYNSITSGFMEHSYTLTIIPMEKLNFSGELSNINYKHFLYNVTTSSLSLTDGNMDPNEKMLAVGGAVSYIPMKNVMVSANYKNYSYDIAGEANYFGGKIGYLDIDSFSAGVSMYRMEGTSDRLRYSEARVYASKRVSSVTLAADIHNVWYDKAINGIRSSYVIGGSAGYEFNQKVRLGAEMEYGRSPDFDNEVRGMLKLTYRFDTKIGGGAKK